MTIAKFLLLFIALWQVPSAPTGLRVGNKMAIALGTNSGFVTAAPASDPAGGNLSVDNVGTVMMDTLPATAAKITKVGVWIDNATEEANFRIALYDNDGATVPGEAGTRLFITSDTAKGTTSGWKEITVNWDVSPYAGTDLWIGIGLDNTATTTNSNLASSGGKGYDQRTAGVALPNPFGGGALTDVDAMLTVYAVWEAAPAGPSIPVVMASYRRRRQ
jgi:hypothetical protein